MKFPGQKDSETFETLIVDTSDDGTRPYKTYKDGTPLPFQVDLEFWTAQKHIPWKIPDDVHYTVSDNEYQENVQKNPWFKDFAKKVGGVRKMADPAQAVGSGAENAPDELTNSTICIKRLNS